MHIRYYLAIVYLIIYILHLFLGPYFYRFWLKGESAKFAIKNTNDLIKHICYITYISFLFTILFFLFPTSENYILALFITVFSLLSYIFYYFDGDYFIYGFIDHSIIIIPFIFYYDLITDKKFTITINTIITFLFLIIYNSYKNQIYEQL